MRGSSFVISSALLLTGGLHLLLAQHSGGHASSGGHAVSGSVHIHSAPSSTTFSTLSNRYPAVGQAVYPTPLGLQRQYSGFTGINPGVLPTGNSNRRGNRAYGYGYEYGGAYVAPYYLSTFDDYDTPYANNNYGQDPSAQTAAVTANLLGEQIAQLSAAVDSLRNERSAPAEPPTVRAPYAHPAVIQQDDPPQPASPVTLVLNNGRKVEMNSYAIMGRDIWDFSVQPAKRISLSNVNLNASRAATEAHGGEFPEIQ